MTAMPYGLGADALTITTGPCTQEHRLGRETPHTVVSVTSGSHEIIDAMLDRDQARAIGLALLNAAEALEY
jgi:hypothetical protein